MDNRLENITGGEIMINYAARESSAKLEEERAVGDSFLRAGLHNIY